MKNKLFYLIVSLLVCMPLFSQNQPMPKADKDGVYLVCDKLPEFPGGMQAMMQYLSSNTKYPKVAQENGTTGRVMVQFVVMEDGKLSRIKVLRGADPLLDEEAVRVVKAMPAWTPGMVGDKNVKVQYTIPIAFNLRNTSKTLRAGVVIPKGQAVKNKKLQGVWQLCVTVGEGEDYTLSLLPLLKILSKNKTFMNIICETGMGKSLISAQGKYKCNSDGYVEKLEKSLYHQFPAGAKNEIHVEFLHDNLIKLTFELPGTGKMGMEYWYRVPESDLYK
nr:TonB family protein [uncultured Bacteroides sp.]